jgi:hypothetical protein
LVCFVYLVVSFLVVLLLSLNGVGAYDFYYRWSWLYRCHGVRQHPGILARVERITGRKVRLVRGDIRDRAALVMALRESGASAVIHFAGLKAVGESITHPLAYYDNNVGGTLHLLEAQSGGLTRCVLTPGAGRVAILTGMQADDFSST